MADTGSTPSFFSSPLPPEQLVVVWDRDIRHAACAAAGRIGGTREDAEDFAQEARIRLFRIADKPATGVLRYVRKVVANAMRTAVQRVDKTPFEEIDDEVLRIPLQSPDSRIAEVAAWTQKIPQQLRAIYEHLYVHGWTQRETARFLGVSQPRVAQLHRQLLEAGRRELQHLAA